MGNQSFIAKFSLFNLFNNLPINELEEIVRELNQLLLKRKKKLPTETDLIIQLNATVLTELQWQRYRSLRQKLEDETMTKAEHTEYMKLLELDRELVLKRTEILVEIAKLRNKSITEVMEDLQIVPINN